LGKDAGELTYNEAMLRGLDYALDEARKAGVRIILVLSDFFASGAGGPDQYLSFVDPSPCGAPPCSRDLFWSDAQAKAYYKAFVLRVVKRTNSINGRAYHADPTVFGWDLMNEPRCQSPAACFTTPGDASTPVIAAWVEEMAAYVRSLDGVHPITVGLDGFYTEGPGTDPSVQPYSTAGAETNADFNLVSKHVDFAEFNVYPDLYNRVRRGPDGGWQSLSHLRNNNLHGIHRRFNCPLPPFPWSPCS
jgi:mannan endo-1,4-beta-mannosidase